MVEPNHVRCMHSSIISVRHCFYRVCGFYMLCDVTEDDSYQVSLGSATLSINSLGGKEIHVYMNIKG